MDAGVGLITIAALLLLIVVLLIFELRRTSAARERAEAEARSDLRRSMELAHSAMHNAPYRQLEAMLLAAMAKLSDQGERTLEAAMAISGEYLALKKMTTEKEIARAETEATRLTVLRATMPDPTNNGHPQDEPPPGVIEENFGRPRESGTI